MVEKPVAEESEIEREYGISRLADVIRLRKK